MDRRESVMQAKIIKHGALSQHLRLTGDTTIRGTAPLPSLLALSWYVTYHAARLRGDLWAVADKAPVFSEEEAMARFYKTKRAECLPTRLGETWDYADPRLLCSRPPCAGAAYIKVGLGRTSDKGYLEVSCVVHFPGGHNVDGEQILLWADLAEALQRAESADPENPVVSYAARLGGFLLHHCVTVFARDLLDIRQRIPTTLPAEGGLLTLMEHFSHMQDGLRGVSLWGKENQTAIQGYDMAKQEGTVELLGTLVAHRKKLLREAGVEF
jgi:hypothetical protein